MLARCGGGDAPESYNRVLYEAVNDPGIGWRAGAKRILFLVDRNNLGRQTLNEFQQFNSPYTGMKFTDEYTVFHLRKNAVPQAAKVVITSIQRLFSMLKGEADYEEENEEGSLYEVEGALPKKPVEVEYNPNLPVETFDFIVTDDGMVVLRPATVNVRELKGLLHRKGVKPLSVEQMNAVIRRRAAGRA